MSNKQAVAGVLWKQNDEGKILVYLGAHISSAGMEGYEFLWGKDRGNLSAEEALMSEFSKQWDIAVEVGEAIGRVSFDEKPFHYDMDCFWCKDVNHEMEDDEACAEQWMTKEQVEQVHLMPEAQLMWDLMKGKM